MILPTTTVKPFFRTTASGSGFKFNKMLGPGGVGVTTSKRD